MLLTLIRTDGGLAPIDDISVEAVKKIKLGYEVHVEYRPKRNYKFHKKYFAMLNAVLHNQERFKTIEQLRQAVQYRAGYFDINLTMEGKEIIVPRSIAFYKMESDEFERLYNHANQVCIELVGDEAMEEILRFI